MKRLGYLVIVAALILVACSKEDGGVTGSEPKEILDNVEQQLDQASKTATKQMEQALERIDEER